MAEENTSVVRDYTDSFSIKDYAFNVLAPKYFPNTELSDLNIGLTGLTMEQIANFTQDAFHTASVLVNEAYPNRAQIPENIYSHAAIFQLDANFASAAKCLFTLWLTEEDILKYAEDKGDYKEFKIDADTTVTVDDIPFTLDYDVIIKVQNHQGTNLYSAQYDLSYTNCISDITSQYIRIRQASNGMVYLIITLHQCVRQYASENIIDNSKINYPVLDFTFENQLAGFDAFYNEPGSSVQKQLLKRLMYTAPVKEPFCYYRFRDSNIVTDRPTTFSVTFSTKDAYFQPEFNSDLHVTMYTTLGSAGNFDVYKGSNISVTTTGDKYEYNQNCAMYATVVGASTGGHDAIDIEELREKTVSSYSTATVISTETDIRYYFNDYAKKFGNDILFIKKRDDVERIFSAFIVMKKDGYIYSTNTAKLNLTADDYDEISFDNEMLLKAGHLFVYEKGSSDTMRLINYKKDGRTIMAYDSDEDVYEAIKSAFPDIPAEIAEQFPTLSSEELVVKIDAAYKKQFVYTNPFMIKVNPNPNLVGYYMNVVDKTSLLDFGDSTSLSFLQFISTAINIKRGLDSDPKFTITTQISPTVTMGIDELVQLNGDGTINPDADPEDNQLRALLAFVDGDTVTGYIELIPTSEDSSIITFKADMTTDDIVTMSNRFCCTNAINAGDPESPNPVYVNASDAVVKLYILHKRPDLYSGNPLFNNPSFTDYIVTNVYSTESEPLTFINSMNMLRSTVTFPAIASDESLKTNLTSVPFIKYDLLKDDEKFSYFISSLDAQYTAIEEVLEKLQNNMHIDIKFYNTYGKSKNFYIGDDEQVIDRVNLRIKFKIQVVSAADITDVTRDLKILIKDYIETLNADGVNNLYISNLIRKIETDIPEIHHCRFLGINDYTTDYQTITARVSDLASMDREERRYYVPEMLVINEDDIVITTYE